MSYSQKSLFLALRGQIQEKVTRVYPDKFSKNDMIVNEKETLSLYYRIKNGFQVSSVPSIKQ